VSLKLKNIKKAYPEFTIDLSFSAGEGELLTLLGPSGCGKTTTLHLIAGFITPDSGEIFIGGLPVNDRAPHERQIGIVFQDYALFPHMNVFSNIAFGLHMHRWGRREINERVTQLLHLVRLPLYEERAVTQLSGGEQQRVALARALAPDPHILLLDEPLSALDAKLRKELRSEIKRIQRELHLTTVYVTHDQEEALAISDTIAVIDNGKIEQTGTPYEIYNQPETSFVADFVGMSNRIEGIVVKSDGNYTEADTPEGRFIARFERELPHGTHISLLFRSEKCRLTHGHNAPNSITGRVTNLEYIGESTTIEIKTKQGTYTAKCTEALVPEPLTSNNPGNGPHPGEGMSEGVSRSRIGDMLMSCSQIRAEYRVPRYRKGDTVNFSIAPENLWILLKGH